MKDLTAKRLSAVHRWVYRLSRGLVGRRIVDNDMMLLTTTGRVTGRRHTVPLLYLDDGDSLVVVASWGGRPDHPEWYANLVADPSVIVQVRGRRWRAIARTADPHERESWWPRVVAAYRGYAGYQAKTTREIPIVFLDPV